MIRLSAVSMEDWAEIGALEAQTYDALGLTEGPAALRHRAAPATSFVARDGTLAGYLLSFPFSYGVVPALAGTTQGAGPDLHLHDLAVATAFRRQGIAKLLHDQMLTTTAGRISLVAVGGSHTYWARLGYQPQPRVPVPATYGPTAVYMTRPPKDTHAP